MSDFTHQSDLREEATLRHRRTVSADREETGRLEPRHRHHAPHPARGDQPLLPGRRVSGSAGRRGFASAKLAGNSSFFACAARHGEKLDLRRRPRVVAPLISVLRRRSVKQDIARHRMDRHGAAPAPRCGVNFAGADREIQVGRDASRIRASIKPGRRQGFGGDGPGSGATAIVQDRGRPRRPPI